MNRFAVWLSIFASMTSVCSAETTLDKVTPAKESQGMAAHHSVHAGKKQSNNKEAIAKTIQNAVKSAPIAVALNKTLLQQISPNAKLSRVHDGFRKKTSGSVSDDVLHKEASAKSTAKVATGPLIEALASAPAKIAPVLPALLVKATTVASTKASASLVDAFTSVSALAAVDQKQAQAAPVLPVLLAQTAAMTSIKQVKEKILTPQNNVSKSIVAEKSHDVHAIETEKKVASMPAVSPELLKKALSKIVLRHPSVVASASKSINGMSSKPHLIPFAQNKTITAEKMAVPMVKPIQVALAESMKKIVIDATSQPVPAVATLPMQDEMTLAMQSITSTSNTTETKILTDALPQFAHQNKATMKYLHVALAESSGSVAKIASISEQAQDVSEKTPADAVMPKTAHVISAAVAELPVIPVGKTVAKAVEENGNLEKNKPVPGSLAAHSIPIVLDAKMPSKTKVTAKTGAKSGVVTEAPVKVSLDKSLLEQMTALKARLDQEAPAALAPAMKALETAGIVPESATDTVIQNSNLLQTIAMHGVPTVVPKAGAIDVALIQKIVGIKGVHDSNDNSYKISVPRSDLNIIVNGVKLTSAMGLTSWVQFKQEPLSTTLKGSLVLTEEQVNAVMVAAIENNLKVTELHNHYLWESPKVVFMQLEGEGNAKQLATAVNKVFAKVNESGQQGNGDFPLAVIDTANTTLNPKRIDAILGAKGAVKDGVYKVQVAKVTKIEPVDAPVEAMKTSATFAGSDDEAVVDGDIALQETELQKVLMALHKAGISIVAINQRVTDDQIHHVMLHYWGVGKSAELAKGLRAALEVSTPKG